MKTQLAVNVASQIKGDVKQFSQRCRATGSARRPLGACRDALVRFENVKIEKPEFNIQKPARRHPTL